MNGLIAFHSQKVTRAGGGNYGSPRALQLPQTRTIKMIHVCVREQDKIRHRKFQRVHGRIYQALQSHGEWPDFDTDARTEDRIGENREAIYVYENGAMADPGRLDPFSVPSRDARD